MGGFGKSADPPQPKKHDWTTRPIPRKRKRKSQTTVSSTAQPKEQPQLKKHDWTTRPIPRKRMSTTTASSSSPQSTQQQEQSKQQKEPKPLKHHRRRRRKSDPSPNTDRIERAIEEENIIEIDDESQQSPNTDKIERAIEEENVIEIDDDTQQCSQDLPKNTETEKDPTPQPSRKKRKMPRMLRDLLPYNNFPDTEDTSIETTEEDPTPPPRASQTSSKKSKLPRMLRDLMPYNSFPDTEDTSTTEEDPTSQPRSKKSKMPKMIRDLLPHNAYGEVEDASLITDDKRRIRKQREVNIPPPPPPKKRKVKERVPTIQTKKVPSPLPPKNPPEVKTGVPPKQKQKLPSGPDYYYTGGGIKKRKGRRDCYHVPGMDRFLDAALSGPVKAYLKCINVTTTKEFLLARSIDLARAYPKWRKKQKMKPYKDPSAAVSVWKRHVRIQTALAGEKELSELNLSGCGRPTEFYVSAATLPPAKVAKTSPTTMSSTGKAKASMIARAKETCAAKFNRPDNSIPKTLPPASPKPPPSSTVFEEGEVWL